MSRWIGRRALRLLEPHFDAAWAWESQRPSGTALEVSNDDTEAKSPN